MCGSVNLVTYGCVRVTVLGFAVMVVAGLYAHHFWLIESWYDLPYICLYGVGPYSEHT